MIELLEKDIIKLIKEQKIAAVSQPVPIERGKNIEC